MNRLKIGLTDNRQAYGPGDVLPGAVGWEFPIPPKAMELRLLWYTQGKGTEDVHRVDTITFANLQSAEARPFQFQLPAAPYSFSGKLISLIWAVELVALPGKESTRLEFVLGPQGKEVLLPAHA